MFIFSVISSRFKLSFLVLLTVLSKVFFLIQISFLLLVPPVANMLAKTPFLDKFNLSAVTLIMSGGAPMTRATEDVLFSRFPNVRIITQGQHLTEYLNYSLRIMHVQKPL